jgi:hypothetical protein
MEWNDESSEDEPERSTFANLKGKYQKEKEEIEEYQLSDDLEDYENNEDEDSPSKVKDTKRVLPFGLASPVKIGSKEIKCVRSKERVIRVPFDLLTDEEFYAPAEYEDKARLSPSKHSVGRTHGAWTSHQVEVLESAMERHGVRWSKIEKFYRIQLGNRGQGSYVLIF